MVSAATMKLSAPKMYTFWIAVVLALLALLGAFVDIPFVSENGFWILFVGFLVLAAGNFFEGF